MRFVYMVDFIVAYTRNVSMKRNLLFVIFLPTMRTYGTPCVCFSFHRNVLSVEKYQSSFCVPSERLVNMQQLESFSLRI